MSYTAPPARTALNDVYPNPSNSVFKAGIGTLWDAITGLFGTDGQPDTALANLRLLDPQALYNLKPVFSVGASALTITLEDKAGNDLAAANPGMIAQRSATAGDGGFNLRKLTANVSMVVSSGSTLGGTTARLSPIYIYLIDNAGAQELAVAGTFQGESGIYSTTAEGGAGAADDPDVMYSTTARASMPGRLVAIAWSNQAAAGTWATLPAEVKSLPFHLERVGVEEAYMGGTVPYGFLLEDGSNVNRTTYAKLFAKVGTAWGVGDGATTFGLPDSRRRVAVGAGGSASGTLGNALGDIGGEEAHALSSAENAAHTHTGPSHTHTGATNGPNETLWAFGGANDIIDTGPGADNGITSALHTHTFTTAAGGTGATGSSGSGTAHNTIQPSMVVTKMIRWLGDI